MTATPEQVSLTALIAVGLVVTAIGRGRVQRLLERELADSTLREAGARDALHRVTLALAERGYAEIVVCSAVLAADGRVFRCHRHHDGLRTLEAAGLAYGEHERAQGFVTSRNRYVDRHEAMRLQRAAGIESVAPGGYRGSQLFSEDLY